MMPPAGNDMAKVRVCLSEAQPESLERLHALASSALTFDTFSAELLHQKLFFNPHPCRDEYHTLVAEIGGEVAGMLQHVVRADERRAWLGLFAIAAEHRRQGVARRLYDAALTAWREKSIKMVDVLTIPTNYLAPGIDPRYTPAVCFVESVGFVQQGQRANMRARLDRDFDTSAQEAALKAQGIDVRRAQTGDWALIERFFGRCFGEGWLCEVGLAMSRDPPGVHLALQAGEIVGFAAHSTMNQEWGNFGPMGTADEARNRGVGRVLLYRCLADLKAAGFASAVIPWVGPYRFYCRLLNCAIERVFWQYRLELGP